MSRKDLSDHLKELHAVIHAERKAARDLDVEKMICLTAEKEHLLKQTQRLLESAGQLTPAEKILSEAVYAENLRNAYFFWSALKWVRESMRFFGDKISSESYGENGSVVKGGYSGALLSGRV